jgi:site-specific DNA-methyltransferase (adenine-specific)
MGHIEAGHYVSQDGGPRLMRSVLAVRSCHGYAEHPTQKPIDLLTPLIEYSCPPGGLVLDPFMGSGSTLVAARQSGRRAIGIEIARGDCETAVARLAQQVLPLEVPA